MRETVFNPQEVGKGIADFGFLIIAGATYLVYSATLFFFFIKWFVRIVNGIIEKQQRVLDEVLHLQKGQKEILENIVTKLNNVAQTMVNIKDLVSFICRWEGGYSNDPSDSGGPTNMGVTLTTWKKTGYDKTGDGEVDQADLTRITHEEMVEVVLRPHYWNIWQADKIVNQSIANFVVDWMWLSGSKTIFMVQKILRVKQDGIVGNHTLYALNSFPDQRMLFDRIKTKRVNDIHEICKKHPKNLRFRRGWLNRIADLKFIPVVLLFFLLGSLIGCRTSAGYQTLSDTGFTENSTAQEEKLTNYQQNVAACANEHITSIYTDSTSETTIIAFKLLNPSDSAGQMVSIIADGKASITHQRKKTSTLISNRQFAGILQQRDSTVSKKVETQTKQSLSCPLQPTSTSRIKPFLAGAMAVVLTLWLYHIFRLRKQ